MRFNRFSDLLLGWTPHLGEHHYLVRQLNDHKGGIDLETLRGRGLESLAQVAGELMARGHARSGDTRMIRGYFGSGDEAGARDTRVRQCLRRSNGGGLREIHGRGGQEREDQGGGERGLKTASKNTNSSSQSRYAGGDAGTTSVCNCRDGARCQPGHRTAVREEGFRIAMLARRGGQLADFRKSWERLEWWPAATPWIWALRHACVAFFRGLKPSWLPQPCSYTTLLRATRRRRPR